MIKELRKKFMMTGMLSVLTAEFLMIGAIDAINYKSTLDSIKSQMEILEENDGDLSYLMDEIKPPEGEPENSSIDHGDVGKNAARDDVFKKDMQRGGMDRANNETPFMLRFFTVSFDSQGQVSTTDTGRIAMVDSKEAEEFGSAIYESGKSRGFYRDYYYSRIEPEDGVMIIFLDCRHDLTSFESFRNISIVVGLAGAALVFFILGFASSKVLAPVEESYRKQRRFITDASHEIKTPLAIISADAEVLEYENEDNEWLLSIKNQVKRLSELTEKLVFLSRMDEGSTKMAETDFDLSDRMIEVCDTYRPVAEASGKRYETDIEPGIHMKGDRENITQLLNLLLDNAFKYSDDEGKVWVSLHMKGKKRVIEVCNTVDSIEKGELDHLFERFYRADDSRSSETGGHGIGLSVVAAIAEAHHGRARAYSSDGKSVVFSVII